MVGSSTNQVSSFIHTTVSIYFVQNCLLYTYVVLIVEFESSRFIGNESSGSVQVVISKSNALSNTIIIVQVTLSEHPSMPATGKHIKYMDMTYLYLSAYLSIYVSTRHTFHHYLIAMSIN